MPYITSTVYFLLSFHLTVDLNCDSNRFTRILFHKARAYRNISVVILEQFNYANILSLAQMGLRQFKVSQNKKGQETHDPVVVCLQFQSVIIKIHDQP